MARCNSGDEAGLLIELNLVKHLQSERVIAQEDMDTQQADDAEVAQELVQGL